MSKLPTINPDNLIPPDGELAHLLAQWSEDTDTRTWNIANVTNELIAELEGGFVNKKDVYRAVAARCKGRKVNTIRRWAEVALDYDAEMQEKYAQLLSFEHFKVSRRLFHDGCTPSIEYGLQWCIEGNDQKLSAGRFHTVGQMMYHFIPELRDNKHVSLWKKVKDDLYDFFLLEDNDTDRERLLEAWKEIDYVLDKKKNL
jgi:hypothetical protein